LGARSMEEDGAPRSPLNQKVTYQFR
jgi:hypothetical protein